MRLLQFAGIRTDKIRIARREGKGNLIKYAEPAPTSHTEILGKDKFCGIRLATVSDILQIEIHIIINIHLKRAYTPLTGSISETQSKTHVASYEIRHVWPHREYMSVDVNVRHEIKHLKVFCIYLAIRCRDTELPYTFRYEKIVEQSPVKPSEIPVSKNHLQGVAPKRDKLTAVDFLLVVNHLGMPLQQNRYCIFQRIWHPQIVSTYSFRHTYLIFTNISGNRITLLRIILRQIYIRYSCIG